MGWLLGGTGVTLAYSAYKHISPVDALKGTLQGTGKTPTLDTSLPVGVLASDPGTTDSPTFGIATSAAIKTGFVRPVLVSVGSQPALKLEQNAAKSFADVEKAYGRNIPLNNTYRTYQQQADAYAKNPGLFGKPGTSNHELGLALDIVQGGDTNLDDPKLIYAFVSNGWFRRGKVIDYNGVKRAEPWHWSYGIPG